MTRMKIQKNLAKKMEGKMIERENKWKKWAIKLMVALEQSHTQNKILMDELRDTNKILHTAETKFTDEPLDK